MRVAGFGFRSRATAESLRDALMRASGVQPVDALATLAAKAEHGAIQTLGATLGLPVYAVTETTLRQIATPTQSLRIVAQFGAGSVAEAVALAVAGPAGQLIAHRVVSADGSATAAIAEGMGP